MEVALDVTDRHAQPVHGEDFCVEAFKPRLVLADQLRFEGAVAVPWHLDGHLPGVAFQRLPALAVPGVAAAVAGRIVFRIPEVMVHLACQHPLHQRLGQLLGQTIRPYQAAPAGRDQLVY